MSTLSKTLSSFSSFGLAAISLCIPLGVLLPQSAAAQGPATAPTALTVPATDTSLAWTSLAWEFDPPRYYRSHAEIIAPWKSQEQWLLEALNEGTVLRTEPIGHGVTNPFKAEIEYEDQRIYAVWKPIRTSDFEVHESYQAEVAAYRLSKYLGIDMVPPTVERKIGRRLGSLQLWVNGYRTFAEVADQRPYGFLSSDQIQLMRFFDALIDNTDRNAGNYMVDEGWRVVLIDHSRAMDFDTRGAQRNAPMPRSFQRSAVERLEGLSLETLDQLLGDLYSRSELRGLQYSARRLLRFVEHEVETHGPSVFFEQPKPVQATPIAITDATVGTE